MSSLSRNRAARCSQVFSGYTYSEEPTGYNGDDLHDAYRDVAVLQKLYDIAEVKATLAGSLMEEDS